MEIFRIDKFLADSGFGTRSQVKQLLKKGVVTVNGEVIKKPETKIFPETDQIICQGQLLSYSKFVYYMLHKPAGVISATEDSRMETVLSILKDVPTKGLFPVGRLDKDTEGLLLITNDGALTHHLLSPKHHVDKTYYVLTDGLVTEDDLRTLERGVDIGEGITTLPAVAALISTDPRSLRVPEFAKAFLEGDEARSLVHLTIHEGKFHQVKRMFEAIGKPVLYLKRLSMGSLRLDESLAPGEFRPLTDEELEGLQPESSLS